MSLAAAGYRLEDVAAKKCLLCSEPIGELAYEEVTTLARFGQMLFSHLLCPQKKKPLIIGVKPV